MKRHNHHSLRQSTAAISARKVLTSPDYAAINAAIERHLDLACTTASQKAIQHCVGAEEFRKIEEIISFTSNQDAWLQDNNVQDHQSGDIWLALSGRPRLTGCLSNGCLAGLPGSVLFRRHG